MEITRSDLAEKTIVLDGRPFSLSDYEPYRAIYDGLWRQTLLKAGRQVGKSTSLANFILSGCVAVPHFRTLYLSPKQSQTRIFSNTRMAKAIEGSPIIKKHYFSHKLTNQMFHRQLMNGSEMYFVYADESADRVRGITADLCAFDEIQDITGYEEVIPVVRETMSASQFGFTMLAGTPKTMENPIEYYWASLSSQTIWVIKCPGCNHWNHPGIENVGKKGFICAKCGKLLDVRTGVWADQVKEYKVKGFHLPQIIFPMHTETEHKWQALLDKMELYQSSVFNNEVLGESDSIGVRLITREELESLCMEDVPRGPENVRDHRGKYLYRVAGVDWGGGGSKSTSRTALVIFGYVGGQYQMLDYKVFSGGNPVFEVDEVVDACIKWDVSTVVADAGGGRMANSLLVDRLGTHKVFQCQYVTQKEIMKFHAGNEYRIDRSLIIDEFFLNLKNRRFLFPRLSESAILISEILAEYEETSELTGRKIWTKPIGVSDDLLHASIYGDLAMRVVLGDWEFKVRHRV